MFNANNPSISEQNIIVNSCVHMLPSADQVKNRAKPYKSKFGQKGRRGTCNRFQCRRTGLVRRLTRADDPIFIGEESRIYNHLPFTRQRYIIYMDIKPWPVVRWEYIITHNHIFCKNWCVQKMYILWYFNCGSDFRDEKWLYGNDNIWLRWCWCWQW